jgi:hypothetical protein
MDAHNEGVLRVPLGGQSAVDQYNDIRCALFSKPSLYKRRGELANLSVLHQPTCMMVVGEGGGGLCLSHCLTSSTVREFTVFRC